VVLLTAQALSDLVAALYGAASDESEWSVFLRELRRVPTPVGYTLPKRFAQWKIFSAASFITTI
jgi:hypothetical protein